MDIDLDKVKSQQLKFKKINIKSDKFEFIAYDYKDDGILYIVKFRDRKTYTKKVIAIIGGSVFMDTDLNNPDLRLKLLIPFKINRPFEFSKKTK